MVFSDQFGPDNWDKYLTALETAALAIEAISATE
jgi:hypothetical protein